MLTQSCRSCLARAGGDPDELEALVELGLDEPPPKPKPGAGRTPPAARDEDPDLAEIESFLDNL
jgi:hypothetical protein